MIQPQIRKHRELKNLEKRQAEQIDLLTFQLNEIKNAKLQPDEDCFLENERNKLKNAEILYILSQESVENLYNAQGSVTERLSEVQKRLTKACQLDQNLSKNVAILDDIIIKIEDLSHEMRGYIDQIPLEESELETVEARLDLINKLKRKYGGSLEAIFVHYETVKKQILDIESITDQIGEIENKLNRSHHELVKLACELSEKRKSAAKQLSSKVEDELSELKMPNCHFNVQLDTSYPDKNTNTNLIYQENMITENGIDRAKFLISTNIGEKLKPLAAIASGGELSRVVLALKAIIAKTESVETIVFDEVDAGIGGDVAEIVGQKILTLAKYYQIVCITHLAQIAKFGNNHYKIAKQIKKDRTYTSIQPITGDDRINEIARMIGGVEITEATLNYAKEMLHN